MQVILALISTIKFMDYGKDVYQYSSCHNYRPKISYSQVLKRSLQTKPFHLITQYDPDQTALSTYYCKIGYLMMLVDQKADDKTCDWMAMGDYRNGGWGRGGGVGAAVVIYFLMNLFVLVM